MGEIIRPKGHEELHCKEGCFTLRKFEDWKDCKKGDWQVFNYAKDMTFNDQYITFTDKQGAGNMIPLEGWILSVIPKNYTKEQKKILKVDEKLPEREQMTIFDFL